MADKSLFAPFSKVEPTSDGGREVWGFASLEVKDKTGEIADFERTVQAFDKWSTEIDKATQGKSKGNIRYMHGTDAVGKMIDWKASEKEMDDGTTAKGVYIGVKVPHYETRTIGQIDDGILTGFSIGGNYADRWYDEAEKCYRYAPELAETSLVDNPAVPGANFDLVRMQKGVARVNPLLFDVERSTLEKKAGMNGEMSYEDIRSLVSEAVNEGPMGDFWIVDTFPDYVIIEDWEDNKFYRVEYSIKGNDVTLGNTQEVKQGDWTPVKEATKTVETPLTKVDPTDKVVDQKISALEAAIEEVKAAQLASQKGDPASQDGPNEKINDAIAQAMALLAQLKEAQAKDEGSDKEDAEKAVQASDLIKSITDKLEKRGVTMSAERKKHLGHAMDHIHKALGNDDKIADKSHFGDVSDGGDKGMDDEDMDKFASVMVEKLNSTMTLQKSVPDIGGVLTQAIDAAGLAKAAELATVTEQLAKAAERIAELESMVKAIGEQPQSGGPMTSIFPGLGGSAPWQQNVEKAALQGLLEKTSDPMLKDALGRQLATDMLAEGLSSARKPTA